LLATAGRLLDLISNIAIKLDRVKTLVLDEADRMLRYGYSLKFESYQDGYSATLKGNK
jgi:superfamily II DNA/RNA helicase|tara:strand:+ start:399 stop:572 length:174 start_codon:yes stop_codon:yes gene_type:complete